MGPLCRYCGKPPELHVGVANACFGGMGTVYAPDEREPQIIRSLRVKARGAEALRVLRELMDDKSQQSRQIIESLVSQLAKWPGDENPEFFACMMRARAFLKEDQPGPSGPHLREEVR